VNSAIVGVLPFIDDDVLMNRCIVLLPENHRGRCPPAVSTLATQEQAAQRELIEEDASKK
jgi:hypothetical protein